jgi:osmotically-inducible protein OsmY
VHRSTETSKTIYGLLLIALTELQQYAWLCFAPDRNGHDPAEVKGDIMSSRTSSFAASSILLAGLLIGCSRSDTRSPEVADQIRKQLDQSGYKDVSVSQDREKGVVTLTGHVPSDADKQQAESIAKSMAVGQVVADEVEVLPAGAEHDTRAVNSDLDKAIDKNLDAALIQNRLNRDVSYDVKNGVVTLKGNVNSQIRRNQAEHIASSVPNVHQVVNELQVKNQKASSSN